MSTPVPEPDAVSMRGLIRAVQAVLRAMETRESPDTLRAVHGALSTLPARHLDDRTQTAVRTALRRLEESADHAGWDFLAGFKTALDDFVRHGPGDGVAAYDEPVMKAVIWLDDTCRHGFGADDPAAVRAWEVAWHAVGEARETLQRRIHPGQTVSDTVITGRTTTAEYAYRHAMAYGARDAAGDALTEVARAWGLFVVGIRQAPTRQGWEWSRRIGSATFDFHVLSPGPGPVCDHGLWSIAVRRTDADGTVSPPRILPIRLRDRGWEAAMTAIYRA
ncbi:hypothetical protein [Streptomyces sp. NPDC097619]|uniref:hypothetical protein n=1 Tax=Streptomyces sp. NPDC097619 TaxID=3157228 RepID=UPI0033338044